MANFAHHSVVLIALLALVLFVPGHSARGGFRSRGSGNRGGGGSSSRPSWSASSSTSHSSPSGSSPSGGGSWFSRASKPKSTSSSPPKPDYPRQPAHNPAFDAPPSYGSLFNGRVPPSYGWAGRNTGSGSGFGAVGFGSKAPQPSGFGVFQPQNPQTSTSYHFVPIFLPHYHSYSYSHNSRASPSSSSSSGNTTTAPAPITEPIVYDMDTSILQANVYQTPKAALVVAVNNMVVYGDLQSGQHLAMVIDEHYADPGEIPERFLNVIDEDEVIDYRPRKKGTTRTTTSTTTTTTTTVAPSTTVSAKREQHNSDTQVLDNHWFSDVDGAI